LLCFLSLSHASDCPLPVLLLPILLQLTPVLFVSPRDRDCF
jgi:hypothetical protein